MGSRFGGHRPVHLYLELGENTKVTKCEVKCLRPVPRVIQTSSSQMQTDDEDANREWERRIRMSKKRQEIVSTQFIPWVSDQGHDITERLSTPRSMQTVKFEDRPVHERKVVVKLS